MVCLVSGGRSTVQLPGKTALVTGGAHRVGRAISLALAGEGCDVAVHFHGAQDDAERTAAEIRSLGVRAVTLKADLRSLAEIDMLFQEIDRQVDGLDLLVNSAAILEPVGMLEVELEDWQRTIDLNLRATYFCLQHAARRMQARGGGAIVNISDIAGLAPWARYPIHSISKAGVEMLTRVAALSLAPLVRVNAVAPGPVLKPESMAEPRWQALGQALPLRRTGTPEDIARSVVFLFQNDFVTGETLVVDGGGQLG
jgi:pteridine reductase